MKDPSVVRDIRDLIELWEDLRRDCKSEGIADSSCTKIFDVYVKRVKKVLGDD